MGSLLWARKEAKQIPYQLPAQNASHKLARHDPRHGGPQACWAAEKRDCSANPLLRKPAERL